MKLIVRYAFMTIVIIQGLFLFCYYTNTNIFGILSWIGKGDQVDFINLFSPLIIFGSIKILYWLAEPISKLFIIILKWLLFFSIIYFIYWLFFV